MNQLFLCIALSLISTIAFTQGNQKITLYFESGKSELSDQNQQLLTSWEKELTQKSIDTLIIRGYSDDVGTTSSNLLLAQNRANEVKNKLQTIDLSAIQHYEFLGKGEIPLSKTWKASVQAQRKMNRRVDVYVSYASITLANEHTDTIRLPSETEKRLDNHLRVGDKVVLRGVLFHGGTDYIYQESNETLDELIFFLKENPQYNITILGHVCCQYDGMDGLDRDTGLRNLSVARAKKVYDILITKGISKKRLNYKGLKGDFPTGLGDEADRRVEIEIDAIEE